MTLPWLLMQYREVERQRVATLRDLLWSGGIGAAACQSKDASRQWTRSLAELDAWLR